MPAMETALEVSPVPLTKALSSVRGGTPKTQNDLLEGGPLVVQASSTR